MFRRLKDRSKAPAKQAPEPALVVPGALKINAWYRTTALVLGLAGLGSGGAAVYLTHVEAGPVALIAVGLLFILIAMAGQLPSRIKIGDNEAEWQAAVERFVERVTEEAPEGSKPQLLDALTDLADSAPQAASAGVSALAYELFVESMLRTVVDTAADLSHIRLDIGVAIADHQFDAILNAPDRVVGVEIKAYTRSLPSRAIHEMAGLLATLTARDERQTSGLIVTKSPLISNTREVLRELSNIYVVVVEGTEDADRLAQAVHAALGLGQSPRRYFAN